LWDQHEQPGGAPAARSGTVALKADSLTAERYDAVIRYGALAGGPDAAKGTEMSSLPRLALASAQGFADLVRADAIGRTGTHLGRRYRTDRGGIYQVFRETRGDDGAPGDPAVLVVGFRLKVIHSLPAAHWLFQRVCLLTTPFWSGFRGFRIKLWMVDQLSKNYLGIYRWAGEENARVYAEALCRVLRALSTRGSVWYEIHPNREFEHYLAKHAV
jgi:hypothetical protein